MKTLAALALSFATLGAFAQGYPSAPVKLVVPYPPGGTADLLGRLVSIKLGDALGQQVVVENRGGAGGNIGTEAVAKATPDGHTLLLGNAPVLAINPNLYRKVAFDPLRDFAPIGLVATVPLMLVAHPSFQPTTLAELIAAAKAQPGHIHYASGSSGSTTHLATELLKSMAGIDVVHVPFKGSGPALAALAGGQVPFMIELIPTALPFVRGGRLRGIAVTSTTRSPLAPDLPTFAESGLPGYEVSSWFGIVAPAKTPPAVVSRLSAELLRVVKSADMRERISGLGAEPVGNTPEEFSAHIRAELLKWASVVKAAGATVD
jgi:tripartite-type tricarboxylate transporter receptor subunit TctC